MVLIWFFIYHIKWNCWPFLAVLKDCLREEVDELTRMRYAYPWWKEIVIISYVKRKDCRCPLMTEEFPLVLRAVEIDRSMQIYIAARVRKETLLQPSDIKFFQNHSSMAALDYLVSL